MYPCGLDRSVDQRRRCATVADLHMVITTYRRWAWTGSGRKIEWARADRKPTVRWAANLKGLGPTQ
jgi:hypothetical protein